MGSVMVLENSSYSIKSNWGNLLKYSLGVKPKDHFVQFYENEEILCETVIKFVLEGIANAEGVVLVVAQSHMNRFEERLRQVMDIEKELSKGQLLILDADKMLNQFIVAEGCDAGRFQALIGSLMSKLCMRFAKIRAFGEMVNILCEKQNFSAAIYLEHLWNDLASKYHFSLLCGYRLANFKDKRWQTQLRQICHVHSHFTPSL
jgi:hypothetical protein